MNIDYILITPENFEAVLPPEFSESIKAEIVKKYQPIFNVWSTPEDLVNKIMSRFPFLNIPGRRYFIRLLDCIIDELEFNYETKHIPAPVQKFRRGLICRKEIFCKSNITQ